MVPRSNATCAHSNPGDTMSILNSNHPILGRGRVLASAAVVAIIASGAIGGSMLSASTSAVAGAVNTADLQTSAMPSFATVVDRVKPAVVSVKVNIEDAAAHSSDLSGQMDNLPPDIQQFFKRFGGQGEPNQTQPRHEMALGSGFLISADGYVVTNNHVVQNAKTVTVTMDGGKTLDAKVIGTDPKTDVAVIKVNEQGDYPYVTFAKEMPRIGDWVVAIGNPYGLGGTVT